MASYAAIDLSNEGYNVNLITYGSPRPGNTKFSEYANKLIKGENWRVTYKDDAVSAIPPYWSGYHHVGTEVHYTDENTMYVMEKRTGHTCLSSEL